MNAIKNLRSNLAMLIISVILAIFVWFAVSMTQYPSVQKTIEHIPLSTDISGSTASENGLSLISCSVEEVTVELLGSRTEVGNLNSDNIEAYLDMSSISTTGTKNITIKIRSSSGYSYEVQSVSPSSASVVLDKYDTREFDVTPRIPNVTAADGKAIDLDEVTCDPETVRINGPSAQLDRISKVCAVCSKTMSLDSAYVAASDDIQIFTEDNSLMDQSMLKLSTTNFNINIPVRTQKTVGLTVALVGAPSDFDQSSLSFIFSADSVTLATNNSQTEIPDTLEIGKIVLSELDLDYSKTFTLSNVLSSSDYINVSGLETVTVTLDSTGLGSIETSLDQSRISISNAPGNNYTYTVLTQKLPVKIIGPEDVIKEITPEDIIADVNLLNADITADMFSYPAAFDCNYPNVWITTDTRVSIQRTQNITSGTTSYSYAGSSTQTTAAE
ncbi:MAG: hypothetical protein IJ874_09585 [Ruminococcus sp.]|nr:hypothetical protein [Ruminococcus sp.]